jgi:hypothetical protein
MTGTHDAARDKRIPARSPFRSRFKVVEFIE